MLKQSPGWAIASLVAAFVAGGLVGWGVSTRVGHGRWRGGPGEFAGPAGGGGPFRARGMHSFLKRELALTPAQEDSGRAVFERPPPRVEARGPARPPRSVPLPARGGGRTPPPVTPSSRRRV